MTQCNACDGQDVLVGYTCEVCGTAHESHVNEPSQEELEIVMLQERLDVAKEKCIALTVALHEALARESAACEQIKKLWAQLNTLEKA